MVKYLVFLPYVYKPYLDACINTLKLPSDNLFIVDGKKPGDPGLAGTANMAIDEMIRNGADWLVFLNPAMRFGEAGGLDIIDWLKRTKDKFVFFTNKYSGEHFAWHCCAIHMDAITKVGRFDPNFYPVYFEDVDYDLRYAKTFNYPSIKSLAIDAYNERFNHSVELAGTKVDTKELISYFATKWGIHPSAVGHLKSYDFPFNDKNNSLAFWPPAKGQLWND